jgi:epoxide hydrolase 4
MEHVRIEGAGGVPLHVARAGTGPPVILLHGFPDDWRTWRPQLEPLVEAGFSVWLPDLRGYGGSGRPSGRAAYQLRWLVGDVVAIVRATGAPRVRLGGHDWGGVVAWAVAGAHGELLDRLVIFNAPHPELYARRVRRPGQLLRSWYAAFFLLPALPERVLAARDFAVLRRLLRRVPARRAFSEDEIDGYVAAMAQPGALTAALNYYRANVAALGAARRRAARIEAETLVIWGERDVALSTSLLDGLAEVAPRSRVHRIAEAGHWVHREAASETNEVLLEFLGGAARSGFSRRRARP